MESLKTKSLESLTKAKMGCSRLRLALIVAVACCSTVAAAVLINEGYSSISRSNNGVTQLEFTNSSDDGLEKSVVLSRIQVAPVLDNSLDNETEKSVVAMDVHNISMVNSLGDDVKESAVAIDVHNTSMDGALPEVSSKDGSAKEAMELNKISMVAAVPEVSSKDEIIQEEETVAVDDDTTKILFETTDSPIAEDDMNEATVKIPVDSTDAITTEVYETSTQIDVSVMSDQVSAAQTFDIENASDVIRMEKTEVTTNTVNLRMNETNGSVLDLKNDMIVSEREGKHLKNRKSTNNVNNINSDNKSKDEYKNVTLPTNESTNVEVATEKNPEPFATLKVIENESVTSFLNCSNSNSTNVCLFTTNLTSLANGDNEPIKDLELTEQLPNNFLNVSVSVHSLNHTLDFKSFQILPTSDSINKTIIRKLPSLLSANKTPISSIGSVPTNVEQDLEYESMISSVTNNKSMKTSGIADSTDFIDYDYGTPMKDIQENTSYSDSDLYAYDYEYPAIDLSSMLATMNFSNIDFNEIDLSAIDLADLDLSSVDLSVLPSEITLDNFDGSKLPSNLDLSSIDLTSLPDNFTVRGITLNDIKKLNVSNINLEDVLSKVNLISTTQSRDTNDKSIDTSDVESNLDISTPVAVVTVDREENPDKIPDESISNFTEKVSDIAKAIDIPLGTTPTKLSMDEVEHVNVESTPNHMSEKTISENYRADDGSELSHLENFLKEATRNLTSLNNLKPEDNKDWVTEEEADLQLIDELGILKLVKMAETVKLDGSGGNLDFMLCVSCKTGVVTAKKLVRELGKDDRTIKALMIYLCISFKLFPSDVCRGTINIAGSELLYVIRRFKHSPAHFCSMVLPEQCKQTPLPAWVPKEPVPTKAPRSLLDGTDFAHLGSPRQPFKKELKILHISDLHLDLEYTEGSAVNCGRPMCCQGAPVRRQGDVTTMRPVAALAKQLITNADDPNNYAAEPPMMSGFRFPTEAGKWGALGGCDLPLRTVRDMLRAATDLKPDLVYMTGDLPAHDIWNQSRTSIQKVLFATAVEMRRAFPLTPTIYTVGNHEAFPVNSFPVPSVYAKGFRPSWLYDTLATVWPLPRRSLQDVRRGGYYSASPLPGLRIISVNTNYCNTLNWWLLLDHVDPVDQLSWLAGELSSSREAGQNVHIVTHIPPGNPDCEAIWSRNFAVLVTKYRDIVKGVFTGHQHVDQWQVIHAPGQSQQGTQVPVAMTYVAPAAATFREHSPAFKMFSVDAQDFRMLDYTVYTANLTYANLPGGRPVYEATYSAKQAYQLPDLSPRSWQRLTYQMAANKTLFDTYIRYAHNYWTEPSELNSCDSRCRRQVLCFLLVGDSSNRKPCAKLPKRFN